MQSPNRTYVPELDQLRAFAALLVFFFHTLHVGRAAAGMTSRAHGSVFTSVLWEGNSGVALFIVLSGFVLARGTLGASIDYWQFMRNRALRILPLMIFVLVFAIYANTNVTLASIVAPFLLLSNTTPRLFVDATNLAATVWTVAVEFQFYLIAPFIFTFVSRQGMRYLLAAIGFVWIIKCLVLLPHWGKPLHLYEISYLTIVGRLNQFLMGVGLAYLWPQIEERFKRLSSRCLLLGLSVLALIALSYIVNLGGDRRWQNWMVLGREIEGVIFASMIAGFVLVRPLRKSLLADWAVKIGVISYSIYILHYCLVQVFWRGMLAYGLIPAGAGNNTIGLLALLLLPVVLAISWLSYSVIEKPFLEMRGRYIRGGIDTRVSKVPDAHHDHARPA